MNVMLKPTGHALELVRTLKVPRERVFAAWTDPQQANRWWAPRDFELLSCTMDVRPGGKWHRRMRSPRGIVVTKFGVYREVVVPERLAFTYQTEEDGALDDETLVTVTFEEAAAGTRLTLRHVAFESEAASLDHRGGWGGALDRCLAFLSVAQA
jgi:uncharacterized protein YndB with AHSA1/START domain